MHYLDVYSGLLYYMFSQTNICISQDHADNKLSVCLCKEYCFSQNFNYCIIHNPCSSTLTPLRKRVIAHSLFTSDSFSRTSAAVMVSYSYSSASFSKPSDPTASSAMYANKIQTAHAQSLEFNPLLAENYGS